MLIVSSFCTDVFIGFLCTTPSEDFINVENLRYFFHRNRLFVVVRLKQKPKTVVTPKIRLQYLSVRTTRLSKSYCTSRTGLI